MKALSALILAVGLLPQASWAAAAGADCKPISAVKKFYQLGQQPILSGKIIVDTKQSVAVFESDKPVMIESLDNPYQICEVSRFTLPQADLDKLKKQASSNTRLRVKGSLAWDMGGEETMATLISPRYASSK